MRVKASLSRCFRIIQRSLEMQDSILEHHLCTNKPILSPPLVTYPLETASSKQMLRDGVEVYGADTELAPEQSRPILLQVPS